jgi:hypothetical protein
MPDREQHPMEARVKDLEDWREYKADPALGTFTTFHGQTAQQLAELTGLVKDMAPAVKAHAEAFPSHCEQLTASKTDSRWRMGIWAAVLAALLMLAAYALPHIQWVAK